jgi:hypothetical protein
VNEYDDDLPAFDRVISVTDRTIDSGADDEFTDDVIAISEHLRAQVTMLYNCEVMDMSLKFGVFESGHEIHLLDGSVSTTTNGFTTNLFEEIPGGDVALTEFIIEQLQSDWNSGRVCVTKGAKCLRADYKCPKMFVILYRAHNKFPTVNQARLYRVLKVRFQAIEPGVRDALVNVCICCLHVYTAEQRIYQGYKAQNQLPKTTEPPQFEAIVPPEIAAEMLPDLGVAHRAATAYSYMINIRNSPYSRSPLPNIEPRSRTAVTPIRRIPRGEQWVDRLYHSGVSPSIRLVRERRGEPFFRAEWEGELPSISTTRASDSLRLAPRTYADRPFKYEFLDQVKERGNRNLRRHSRMSK